MWGGYRKFCESLFWWVGPEILPSYWPLSCKHSHPRCDTQQWDKGLPSPWSLEEFPGSLDDPRLFSHGALSKSLSTVWLKYFTYRFVTPTPLWSYLWESVFLQFVHIVTEPWVWCKLGTLWLFTEWLNQDNQHIMLTMYSSYQFHKIYIQNV